MLSGRVQRAILGVAGVVLLSKILGFLREVVIADKFGTSAEYDLYLIAIMLPALAYGVLNYAGVYLFVPYLTKKLKADEVSAEEIGWRAVWPSINLTLVIAVGAMLMIILSAPYLMKVWAGNYLADDFARIVFYSRITAVIVVLGTTEAFMRSFLNVKKIFTYPAAGYIVFNVFAILGIILFYRTYSVGAVVIGLLGGLFVQNLYLFSRLCSFRPFRAFSKSLYNADTRALIGTGSILLIVELINRSYFLIDRYFAPFYGEGIVSALNYSQVLVQLPDSIVGFAIGAVVFPLFAETSGEIEQDRFAALYRKTITGALLIAAPLAAFVLVNATDLVALIFYRGVFDAKSVALTAAVLKPYTPSIMALFVVSASIRACYSRGWSRPVLAFTVFLFVTKFAATALLPRWFGFPGISAATTISQVGFAALLLLFVLRRSEMPGGATFLFTLLRIVLAAVLAALVVHYSNRWLPLWFQDFEKVRIMTKLALSGTVLLAVYGISAYLLGLRPVFKEYLSRPRT